MRGSGAGVAPARAEGPAAGKGRAVTVERQPIKRPFRTRVLVVDDMALVRETIARALAAHGYEAEEAAEPAAALQLAQCVRWDAVVLDVDLPGMNGFDLYAELVRCDVARRLPVVFITGRPEPAEARLAALGMAHAALLAKPFTVSELVVTLSHCLNAVRHAVRRAELLRGPI